MVANKATKILVIQGSDRAGDNGRSTTWGSTPYFSLQTDADLEERPKDGTRRTWRCWEGGLKVGASTAVQKYKSTKVHRTCCIFGGRDHIKNN